MGLVKVLLETGISPFTYALIPQKYQRGLYLLLKKCCVPGVTPVRHAARVHRWHGKMKSLTSLDYSSDLHDDTNYIV